MSKEELKCIPPIHQKGCNHKFDGIEIPVRHQPKEAEKVKIEGALCPFIMTDMTKREAEKVEICENLDHKGNKCRLDKTHQGTCWGGEFASDCWYDSRCGNCELCQPKGEKPEACKHIGECIECGRVFSLQAEKDRIRGEIKPEQLHEWYLEATKELNPESFNPNAQKSYEDLTEEQKFIDKYIVDKIKKIL